MFLTQRHLPHMDFIPFDVLTGRESREGPKVVNEVRLIVVAALRDDTGPIDLAP